MDERVGIRELRQDLSRYLRRVRSGERLTVTEHGRPVAVLSPWADAGHMLERLVAQGRLRRGNGRLLDIRPLPRPISRDGSEALEEQRKERL
jgi:prevent-host-death family protein